MSDLTLSPRGQAVREAFLNLLQQTEGQDVPIQQRFEEAWRIAHEILATLIMNVALSSRTQPLSVMNRVLGDIQTNLEPLIKEAQQAVETGAIDLDRLSSHEGERSVMMNVPMTPEALRETKRRMN